MIKIQEKISRFRERVGGSVPIFFCSAYILLYSVVVLIPETFYSLYHKQWKDSLRELIFGIFCVVLSRGLFLFSHWLYKQKGRVVNWLDLSSTKLLN